MNSPPRKSPTAAWGLENNFRLGRHEDNTALALPASARFDRDGLVLPSLRDADAVATAIIASGVLDRDTIFGRLNGWRLYQGKWYAECGGKIRRTPRADMDTWLSCLLYKCVVVSRGGRLRPFNARRASVSAVRCALGRALTVCDDPMRELVAAGGDRG